MMVLTAIVSDQDALYFHQTRVLESTNLLGSDHRKTLEAVHDLGIEMFRIGDYHTAEDLDRKVFVGTEKLLGPEHPDTIRNMRCLAEVYAIQGRLEPAVRTLERSLMISEKVNGPEYLDTIRSMGGLSLVYKYQRNYSEAERLQCDIQTKIRHLEDESEQISKNNTPLLAFLYFEQQSYETMDVSVLLKILEFHRKAFGEVDLRTARSIVRLMGAYMYHDKFDETRELGLQSLKLYESHFGEKHLYTLDFVYELGLQYWKRDDLTNAEEMLRRVV